MNHSFLSKGLLVSAVFTMVFAPLTFVQAAPSGTPSNVEFAVSVNGYPENPTTLIGNAYINMYKVIPVRPGIYKGEYVETKRTRERNGDPAVFTVKPGEMVNFVGFTNLEKAIKTRQWTFTTPPLRNFGVEGKLCKVGFPEVNGVGVFKLESAQMLPSCVTGISVRNSDQFVVKITPVNPADDVLTAQGTVEIWIMNSSDPLSLQRNAKVYLFDEKTGRIIGSANNGDRGIVTFIIERNRAFYYKGYKNGVSFGGRVWAHIDSPRVNYIMSDGRRLRGLYDGSETYVMTLNAYPRRVSSDTVSVPATAPLPLLPAIDPETVPAISVVPFTSTLTPEDLVPETPVPPVEPVPPGQPPFSEQPSTPTSPVPSSGTVSGNTKVAPYAVVTLDYLYFLNGLNNQAESGSFKLDMYKDYKRRGFDFFNKRYTSVSGGAFYMSANSSTETLLKFFGNNVGQGGLVDLGIMPLSEAKPPVVTATSNPYNRSGVDIKNSHTYAVYDKANDTYALITVKAISNFNPFPEKPVTKVPFLPLPKKIPTNWVGEERCDPFNVNNLTIVQDDRFPGKYLVKGFPNYSIFYPSQREAALAINAMRKNNLANKCTRHVYGTKDVIDYWLTAEHKAPQGGDDVGEDCIPFNANKLGIKKNSSKKWILVEKLPSGSLHYIASKSSYSRAKVMYEMIKKYGFNEMCYVGRPGPSMTYFKKN